MISLIGDKDGKLNKYFDRQALHKFIAAGGAGQGIASQICSVKDVGFLKHGCEK